MSGEVHGTERRSLDERLDALEELAAWIVARLDEREAQAAAAERQST